MKKALITTIAATIALASASTFAYAAKDGDKRGGRGHGPNIERMLEKLDTNKDGGISLEEVKTSRADLFTKVDANNDQSLTMEEFEMIKEIHKAERAANKPEGAPNTDKPDTDKPDTDMAQNADKEGKRGKKGKYGGKGERGGKRGPSFERLDADSSGTLSLTEFTGQADKMFERMDRNSDGVINADDMKRKKG